MKNSHHTCDPKCGRTKGLGIANPRTLDEITGQGQPIHGRGIMKKLRGIKYGNMFIQGQKNMFP